MNRPHLAAVAAVAVLAVLGTVSAAGPSVGFGGGLSETTVGPDDGPLEATSGQVVRGETPLSPGTGLTVRVLAAAGNPFVRSAAATVGGDHSFNATFDLSGVSPGTEVRVLVVHDGEELANVTAEVVAPEGATPTPGTATELDYEGDALALQSGAGQVVSGTTALPAGTEVVVRLQGSGGQAFVRQATATVREDGTFRATFDLSGIDPGASFTVTVVSDGEVLAEAAGEVVESG